MLKARISVSGTSDIHPDAAVLMAEATLLASQFATTITEAYASEAEKAEQRRLEERKQRLRDRAVRTLRRRKFNEAMRETLQWLEEENGRLTRHDYRSTVQVRPITNVVDTAFSVRTERGDIMYISFSELKTLDIKYDGDRSFTRINLPMEDEFKVTTEEIEQFVAESIE